MRIWLLSYFDARLQLNLKLKYGTVQIVSFFGLSS